MTNRAKDLFLDLLELPVSEREAHLSAACAGDPALRRRVEALLDAHEAAARLLPTEGSGSDTFVASWLGPHPGDRIGDYQLIELIGEGGFGQVFLAEQERPVKRRVALKLIKLGMDTQQVISRFEAERQALAMMDHPNIAKVFDGGATEQGRPYFVMEYVEGTPITEYCERRELGLNERLELFHSVCLAVRHAHQKAILHRDLKPANVLVEEKDGVAIPKVIDFGIAKALDEGEDGSHSLTREGQVIGTPACMSPEQVVGRGDIDTRSDVYALGALLYELITGLPVFDLGGLEIYQLTDQILERDPVRPSQRIRQANARSTRGSERSGGASGTTTRSLLLPRDLDWVCLRCLEKDRTRRYQSVSALADDVRRFLAHEPVEAAPPGAVYRAGKFVRRHRWSVAAAATAVLALGVAGAGLSVGLVRARAAEKEARSEAATAERMASILSQVIENLSPEDMGRALMRDLRARVRAGLAAEGGPPEAEAEGSAQLDDLLRGVNPTNLARTVFDDGILACVSRTIDEELAEEPTIAARLRVTLGTSYVRLGLFEVADPLFRSAAEDLERELGPLDRHTLTTRAHLASLLHRRGLLDASEAELEELLPLMEQVFGADHRRTLGARGNLAMVFNEQGRSEEAEVLAREVWEGFRRIADAEHPDSLRALGALALALKTLGRQEEAAEAYWEVLEGQQAALGDDHTDTLVTLNNLGSLLTSLRRYEEAESLFREALEARRRIHGERNRSTVSVMCNLGNVLYYTNRREEAESLWLDVLQIPSDAMDGDRPLGLQAVKGLATSYGRHGRHEEAESLLLDHMTRWSSTYGREHADTLAVANALAELHIRMGRLEEAEALLAETLASMRRVHGPEHGTTLNTINNLAVVYVRLERYEEAQAMFEAIHEARRRQLGERHDRTTRLQYNLACLAAIQGNHGEALDRLSDAAENGYANTEQIHEDSDLDVLREDPRFAEILEQVSRNRVAE